MVLGYHLVLAAYGFWLPNDPRGSGSVIVGSRAMYEFGEATYLPERHTSVAHATHDPNQRRLAKRTLRYPPIQWSGIQARSIMHAFADELSHRSIAIWAAAILPDHLHLVLARSDWRIERLANSLKGAATRALRAQKLHPMERYARPSGSVPKMFARGYWATYLDSIEAISAAIRYVERNPVKDGLPEQRWPFVEPIRGI